MRFRVCKFSVMLPEWAKLSLGVFICVSFICIVLFAIQSKIVDSSGTNPFEPMIMAEARYSRSDMVGDLGGMPVTIPRYFANFVEYEGDPGWSGREEVSPKRNHHSKLVSFGFEVRFPDMAGLSNDELRKNHQSYNIYNTQWVDVSVTTGKNYGDGLFLQRKFKSINQNRSFEIEHRSEKLFGLEVYSPVGVDIETRKPFKIHSDDEDFFVSRDQNGDVLSLIVCSNVEHAAAPCDLHFSLHPSLKAWIKVHFRRGLLSEWKEMQSSVTQLILGFKSPITSFDDKAKTSALLSKTE